MQTNISYLSPLRGNVNQINGIFFVLFCFFVLFSFFLEEPIIQHPPDAHTQIHTQCLSGFNLGASISGPSHVS